MSEELLINITSKETRVAIVENGLAQELHVERTDKKGIVGNIYMGRVIRVLPGMQAAFVDIGLEKAAFIHAFDIQHSTLAEPGAVEDEKAPIPDIKDLLTSGQKIVVQVTKDPIHAKGARLTTRLSIPSRYLVYLPDIEYIGISQKIEDEAERDRLRALFSTDEPDGGYIFRTAAEGATDTALQHNRDYLLRVWKAVQKKIKKAKSGAMVYEDHPLSIRAIRDFVRPSTEKIRLDNPDYLSTLKTFAKDFVPQAQDKLELYSSSRPLFDLHGVEDELQAALKRHCRLKSGGHLVFDQTEAMTTVDVNTGAFVGHSNLEETIFKTNLEATQVIARQLRLRNIGGIIIIDFIDMSQEHHKSQVLQALTQALAADTSKTKICDVSPLGLVEMTRKRTRESLEQLICEPCPVCEQRGHIKTAETVCYEVFREILRTARTYEANQFLVLASQTVVDRFLDEDSDSIAELESVLEKTISFQVESSYTQEQFDVVLM